MAKKKEEDLTEFGGLRVVWLEAFVRSVEASSRVAAAAQMGVDQATVTKHIQKLEKWLARGRVRPLVDYQVWPLRLTSDGEKFLPQAKMVLETLRQARISPIEMPLPEDTTEAAIMPNPDIQPREG
ncbi:LysR family transcriptional regulator [Brevundimonas sp. Leaf168]|uniref:LysR family transcriptional regulator n=1 Tax=Brevundimonas sp. Leaf168 TaxID=1736283 RepID=UPI0006F3D41F|nr:LysR family transcriptional regulator [Brevundimonas sp. Leaf168]KQR57210.1 hypothetical protein ASF81_06570 [Brevundimonas sp. Leaf168]